MRIVVIVGIRVVRRPVGMKTYISFSKETHSMAVTNQNAFERTIVDLGNEDFNPETGRNNSAKSQACQQSKRNLEQLSHYPLLCRKELNRFARDGVGDFFFICKRPSFIEDR